MILITAIDKNWGIGKDNKLLYSLPEDMAFFKKMTTGKTVLMGRKTLESFKNQKPLPNRKNLVLTSKNFESKYSNLEYINDINNINFNDDSLILIGGASLYKQLFNKCKYAYITKIDKDDIAPDVYFPNLDLENNWKIEKVIEKAVSKNGIPYEILLYKNEREV